MTNTDLKEAIRDIPNFPKEGIIFKDITTLLKEPHLLKTVIDRLAEPYRDQKVDYVVGIESRGFILGTPLATELSAGFVPVRKKGKLPGETRSVTYDLEYGTDTVEIHTDALTEGSKIVICDDLLATGGTCAATVELVKDCGADIQGISFLIELEFLKGIEKLSEETIHSLIKY